MMPSVNKGEESELYLKSFLLREKTQNRKDTIFGKIIQEWESVCNYIKT